MESAMSTKTAVDLFTPEEHRILSEWLEVEPKTASRLPSIDEALGRLGFDDDPGPPYSNVHAAVAFIVLEAVEKRIQRAVLKSEEPLAALFDLDGELIAVLGTILQGRENKGFVAAPVEVLWLDIGVLHLYVTYM